MIDTWVKSLGRTFAELTGAGTIPNQPLHQLYEDRGWLHIEPTAGVVMEFAAGSKRLTKLLIVLLPSEPGDPVYRGSLPQSLDQLTGKPAVRSRFGEPMESKGPFKLPGGLGTRGGWDAYRIETQTHPAARVGFSYTGDMRLKTVAFALLDADAA